MNLLTQLHAIIILHNVQKKTVIVAESDFNRGKIIYDCKNTSIWSIHIVVVLLISLVGRDGVFHIGKAFIAEIGEHTCIQFQGPQTCRGNLSGYFVWNTQGLISYFSSLFTRNILRNSRIYRGMNARKRMFRIISREGERVWQLCGSWAVSSSRYS